MTDEEQEIQAFGQTLFKFLLAGEALSLFRECQKEAEHRGRGVRLKLHIDSPQLAELPWEYLWDPRRRDYLCLDPDTPLVRYLDLAGTVRPLGVKPPLRILGMVASPRDRVELDVAEEKRRMERALAELQADGLVELTWLDGQSWRALQRAMRAGKGPWHIFHFIGHAALDTRRDEGMLLFADANGNSQPISATQLNRLLAKQRRALRLVLLNACESARVGQGDIFSSTAGALVRGGIPAVLAMQYEITDGAAVELARTFYEALAAGDPVDSAVSDARNAINFRDEYSLEWGTPVLYMRAKDGRIFEVGERKSSDAEGHERGRREPQRENDALPPAERRAARQPARVAREPEKSVPPITPIDFDWVTIPAGEFLMGSDKRKDSDAYDNELPQHRIHLPEYYVGKAPVTVAQFEIFVRATGYKTIAEKEGSAVVWTGSEWSNVEGADWAHPRGPDSNVSQKADHPVTCVAWHDALEFCKWANVRLPTEAEWEKVARGTDGRIYPWGDNGPDKNCCNFNMNVGDTTPVGQYPKGASPYGVLDMSGNVWEWTGSLWGKEIGTPEFGYRYDPTDGRENLAAADGIRRVLRGGAFNDSRRNVRAAPLPGR